MREIKFRAWWVGSKLMESWKEILRTEPLSMYFEPDERTVLMQYTGLKDKNGKEIYEGDIVLEYESGRGIYGIKYEVAYEHNGFWLKDRDNECGFGLTDDMEIIGNIYENSELIN